MQSAMDSSPPPPEDATNSSSKCASAAKLIVIISSITGFGIVIAIFFSIPGAVSSITGFVIIIAVVIFCVRWLQRIRAAKPAPAAPHHDSEAVAVVIGSNSGHSDDPQRRGRAPPCSFGPQCFTYEQLSEATKHFNDTELLGQGGSGSVYRGKLPNDGPLVAVKCIPEDSNQAVKEFNAEVSIISDLRHRNLVKLKGWCHDQGKFLLVYDYMPNGSLNCLLFNDTLCVKLDWALRYAVATGLGSALMYLHNECDGGVVIHRDVKSSNVLLDEGFVAKLGDFGLSRLVDPGATSHTTSVVAGTRGYMAPELFVGSGKATRKTDMYAFGAVLLEVVSGKHVLDASLLQEYQGVLVDWVWDLFRQGRELEAVDQRLGRQWDRQEARRMLVVGLACLHPDAQSRPEIRHALDALYGTVVLPFVPPWKPPSFAPSRPIMSISQIIATTS